MTAVVAPTAEAAEPTAITSQRLSPAAWFLAKLIRGYRIVSAWTPPHCRFAPTCSQYALDAVVEHGAVRGSWLAVRRISRCHPWNAGGFDPVPRRTHVRTSTPEAGS